MSRHKKSGPGLTQAGGSGCKLDEYKRRSHDVHDRKAELTKYNLQ